MTIVFLIAGLLWVSAMLFVVALCASAARGDRALTKPDLRVVRAGRFGRGPAVRRMPHARTR